MHAAPQLFAVSLGFTFKPAFKTSGLGQLVHNVSVLIDLRPLRVSQLELVHTDS